MPFPPYGSCPLNKEHLIQFKSKGFIKNTSLLCNKCNVSFYHVYYNEERVNPHFYHCQKCETNICFNCAQVANDTSSWINPNLPLANATTLRQRPKIINNIERLKLNDIFHDMNDNLLQKCMKKVVKLFGGYKSMLYFISNNANTEQLSAMHKTVIRQNTKYNKYVSNDESSFKSLPTECMCHIVGYLNKKDIKKFKLSSRKTAIICLEEMKKISIKTINGNAVLNNTNIDAYDLKLFSSTRYNGRKVFGSLFRNWSARDNYNIQENNQLVFQLGNKHTSYQQINMIDRAVLNNKPLNGLTKIIRRRWGRPWPPRDVVQFKRPFYVLDKNKVVMLADDNEKGKIFDHGAVGAANHNLMVLRYFDIMQQKASVVQYILYPCENFPQSFWQNAGGKYKEPRLTVAVLLKYIESYFIEIKGLDNTWYAELKHILRQMNNDAHQHKLSLYKKDYYSNTPERCICFLHDTLVGGFGLYTFQINPHHPWFAMNKTNKFDEMKTKCKENNVKFHSDVLTFYKQHKYVLIETRTNKDMLAHCIRNYYDNRLNNEEKEIFKSDMQTIYDLTKISKHRIQCSSGLQTIEFKKRISKIYGNIIQPKFIRLISNNCYILLNEQGVVDDHETKLFHVHIYTPEHGAYPFYQESQSKTVTIAYKQQFDTDEFIADLFEIIYKSTDHILYDAYKHLLHLYYDMSKQEDDDDDDDCDCIEPERITKPASSNKIKCILQTNNEYETGTQTFDNYANNQTDEEVVEFNLFMVKIKQQDEFQARHVKLKIEFNAKGIYFTPMRLGWDYRHNRVGSPLHCWINKTDTLQYVIDKYLKASKHYLQACYKIKEKDGKLNKTIISKQKWSGYLLYFEMDLPNEHLLCQFKTIKHPNVKIPKYTHRVYQQFDSIK